MSADPALVSGPSLCQCDEFIDMNVNVAQEGAMTIGWEAHGYFAKGCIQVCQDEACVFVFVGIDGNYWVINLFSLW